MACIQTSCYWDIKRYKKLFEKIIEEKPDGVFIGGDILPNQFGMNVGMDEFLEKNLLKPIIYTEKKIGKKIRYFIIMGNDDPRRFENILINADEKNIIDYVNERTVSFEKFFVTGYCFIPPTPFQLKDWERYDVSRFVDVGAISPEEGMRSIEVDKDVKRFSTIKDDLDNLKQNASINNTIFLFHSPPYDSSTSRGASS